jgi:triosephosphate isomerase
VVYGGSVDAASAGRFAAQPSVDGLFIGRAALTTAGFIAVIEQFCAARPATHGQLISKGTGHDSG